MPSPDELYGSPAATSAPASTPTTGGEQTYMDPEAIYGPAPMGISRGWEQLKEDLPALGGAAAAAPVFATAGAEMGTPFGPPGIAIGGIVGGVVGALVGGAGGKGYQLAYREATGSDKAPDNSYDAAVEIAKAGGEQAVWELGGQLLGKTVLKGIHLVRPKAVEGIEKLSVALEKAGGRFTASMRADSWMLHQLDSLTRGSMTGSGVMKSVDVLNDKALKIIENGIRQNIAKNVTDNLSERELGNLFMDTINGGQAAHKTAVKNMYEGFDTLVPVKTIQNPTTVMEKVGVDEAGRPITRPVTKMTAQVILPVETSSLKSALTPFKEQLERLNYANEDPKTIQVLKDVFSLPDNLSFADAQAYRSSILDTQRNLENAIGKTKITGKINTIVDEMTKAMDAAALKEGPQTLARYEAIKRFAEKGYKAFNDDFVIDLLKAGKANPADIGATLFKVGNEQEIINAKRALRYAAAFGKEQGISYDKTWTQMQSGYLNDVLTRNSKLKEVAAGATQESIQQGMLVSGKDLLKEFTDPKKQRTLAQVFSKEQRDSILELAKVAERVQRKPQGGLGMVASIAQGGMVAGVLTGTFETSKVGSLFLSPYVMAKIMSSPKGSRLLATALETPTNSPLAVPLMSRLAAEAYKANQAEEQ